MDQNGESYHPVCRQFLAFDEFGKKQTSLENVNIHVSSIIICTLHATYHCVGDCIFKKIYDHDSASKWRY